MTQTLIDISKIKDFDSAAAVDKVGTILAAAGIASNGTITAGAFNGTVGATTPSTVVSTAFSGPTTGVVAGTAAAAGVVGELLYGELKGTGTTATVTITIAAPGVITWTTHGFSTVAPQPVVFTTSSALPTGITSGTVYYTVPSTVTTSTFSIATTVTNALAGTAVTTSGSQSGTQTGTAGTALSTGTAADVSGLALTAGDWDVWGQVAWNAASSTTVTRLEASVNQTTATLAAAGKVSGSSYQAWLGTTQTATNGVPTQHVPTAIVNVSTTTNVFLVASSAFGTSTNGAYGFIAARRRR